MTLHRRTLLTALCSVLATAGCLGSSQPQSPSSDSPQSPSPNPSPSNASSTRTRSVCQVETTLPSTEDGPTYPSLPSSLSAETASDFATTFESAYQLNKVREKYSSVDSVTEKAAVVAESTETDRGWLLAVRVDVGYSYPSRGETPQTTHGDFSAYASYFVTADRTVRIETSGGELVDPREQNDGSVVVCAD